MTDDDRINRLDRTQAQLTAELKDLRARVNALSSLPVSVAKIEGSVEDVKDDVHQLTTAVGGITATINDRSKVESQERAAMRRALIALAGTIGAALIAAAVTIVVAAGGLH